MVIINYSKAIYRILKTIDIEFEKGTQTSDIFDLEKLDISYRRLCIILKGLYDDGYIDGVDFIPILGSDIPDFKLIECHLTISGMIYLEDNTTMKNAYKLLKEAKEWIPGL